jgi:hypothetical protein
MCLILTETKPIMKKATKDIVVYKVIGDNGSGWFYNLIIDGKFEKWTRGFEYIERDFETEALQFGRATKKYKVNGNAFHSKKTHKSAEEIRLVRESVVKMIIPKGAYYYESDLEYVSNRIIFPELDDARIQ